MLRPAQRRLLLLSAAFALSLLSCGREVTGPDDGIQTGRSRFAALGLDPRMPDLMASLEGASEAVPFEDVRVVLRREDGTVAIDTVIAFPAGEDTLAVTLLVPIPLSAAADGLPLSLTMAYINAAGDTVFRGGPEAIIARPIGTPGADAPVQLEIVYDGVGKDAAAVVITTVADTVTAGTSSAFIAEARDGLEAIIAGTPLFWYTLDSSRASVPNAGVSTVTWGPARGTARIVAALPNNLRADTIAVYVKLPPSKLVVGSGDAQTGVVHEPLAQPIVVRTLASDDVPVGGVIVTFAVATGGGTLTALSDTSDANGDVSTSWTLGGSVGAQTITATAAGLLPAPLTITATAGAGAPARLAITAAPTAGTAGLALTPALAVAVQDTAGNVATSFTGNVTVMLPAGSTATLGGTLTRAAVAGVATFDDLTLDRVGEYPLIVASDALVPDTSAAVSIAHGAATALVFTVPPTATEAGAVLAPALVVEARDAFGNLATGFTDAVTMAISAGTPGAVLGGTTVRAAVGGIATFDDLTIDLPGLTYQLSASAGGLTPAVSGTFSVSSAGPTTIALFSGDGQSATVNTQIAAPIYVRVSDAGDNPVENVTVLFSIAQGQAFLGTATVLTDASGHAATDVVMGDIAGTILVHATVDGLAGSPVVFTLTATAGLPQSIEVVTGNAQTAVAGTLLADSAVVRVLDQHGNLVPGASVSFNTVTGASAFSDTMMLTDAAGRAAVQVTAGTVAGAQNFSAVADGVVVPATFTVTVTPAALAQFVLQSHPSAGTAGTLLSPAFIVQPRDAFGNPRAVITDSAIISIEEGPVGAILSGTLVRFSDAGLISFGDVSVDLAGNYRFRIEAEGLPAVVTPPFTEVLAGAADSLLLLDGDSQAAPAGGTLPQPMRVRVADALGNPVGGVMVTWAVTSGDVVLTAPTSVTDASGVAVMGLTAGGTTGTVTVEASVGGLTGSPVGFLLAVAPGAPARLSAANGIIINAGQTYPPNVVIALDAFGNPTAGLAGDVTASVDSGPPAGVLLGTTTVTPVAGIATFSDLRLEIAGSYRIRFQSAGLADTVVSGYAVLAGPAFTLAMVSGSAQTDTVGATIDSLQVRVTDAFGNPITGAGVTWDVTTGDASLSAVLTATDTLGLAAVALTFGSTPGPVEVTATSGALSGSPQTFVLTAVSGAAGAMVVTSAPSPVPAATATEYAVEVRDSFGNVVTGFTEAVTVAVVSGPAASFLSGTTSVNAVAGVATFTDLQFGAVGTYGIRFQALGLPDVDATVVVESGAPASWSVISGDNQTGQATLPLDLPLAVLVLDGAGNPVVGDSVRFVVTSGGGAFPNGFATDTILTDVDGIAAVEWFLGATLGAQGAQAEHATLTPLTFSATAAELVGNRVWTGDASTDITDPANWKDGLVPTASDSVLVPAGRPNYPALASNLITARLTVEDGATVDVGQWLLFVNGSVVAPAVGITSSDTGAVVLQGATGAPLVRGGFPRLVVAAGTYSTSGAVSTVTDLNILGTGDFEPGAHVVTVGRDLTTAQSGRLSMMLGTSELNVARHALFGGASTDGRLTSGILRVGDDFLTSTPSAFVASAGHTVQLTGLDAASIGLFEADTALSTTCGGSCFGTLLGSKTPGDAGIEFLTPAKAVTQMDLTTAVLNATGQLLVSGGTARLLGDVTTVRKVAWADGLERSAVFNVDTLVAWGVGSVIAAGENIPTIVAGDVRIAGTVLTIVFVDGVLDVDGTAQITGSLITRGSGRLRMTEGTDSLTVPTVSFGGTTDASFLTAGTLVVTFSFTQSGAGVTTYAAQDGNHRLRFSIPGFTHFLNVADAANNPIGSLSVSEGVEVSLGASNLAVLGTVTLDGSTATVNGSGGEAVLTGGLVDAVGGRWDVTTTRFQGDGAVLPKVMDFDVRIAGAIALTDTLTVGGDLRATGPTGVLTVGGQYVSAQTFGTYEGGRLVMADAADTLRVAGATTFEGGTSSLTAGYLEVGGQFTQGVDGTAFQAAPTHATWFTGATEQVVTFANPGFGAAESHFGELYHAKPAGVNLTLDSDVFVNGPLETGIVSTYAIAGTGQRLVTRGAAVNDILFSGVRWEIVEGADIAPLVNVTFNNPDPTLTALRIARPGGAVSLVSAVFLQVPTTGYYLEAEDVLGDADVLTVTMTGTSPTTSGGRANTLGGAVIAGWQAFNVFTWSGATSTVWTDPSNWVQNAVPTPSDSVEIPEATPNLPAITAPTTVRVLRSLTSSPITLASELTVTDRLSLSSAPTSLTCPTGGEVRLVGGADSVVVSGGIACLLRASDGRVSLAGPVTADSVLIDGTGLITVNEWTLAVAGDVRLTDAGAVSMDQATSAVSVGGDLRFEGTGAQTFNAGRLELSGDLQHNGTLPVMFIVIALVGSEPQQIGAPTTGQPGTLQFDRLELSKSALALVTLTSSITLNGEFDVSTTAAHHLVSDGSSRQIVARGGSAPAGAALTVDNISLYYIDGGTLASELHGFSFLNFPADNFPLYFGRSADAVTLHNFAFEDVVAPLGFVTVQDTDGAVPTPLTITMVNPSPLYHGGRVNVDNGAVLLGWAAEPDFTWTGAADQAWANPLNWADNLVPTATDSATIPSGASVSPILDDEIVALRALVNQSATVPLDLMGTSQLTITERLVTDGAGEGLTCSPNSFLALSGTATATGRVGGCRVQAVGGTVAAQDSLVLGSSLILQNDAAFDVNDAVVRVAGEFEVLGTAVLTMDGVNDSLLVDSTAQFQGGAPVLTAGLLRIGGSFVQTGVGNFSASGAHVTQLYDVCLGSCGIPVISFADTARANTFFHHLTILDGARDIQTPLTVNGDFRVETEAAVTSPEVGRVGGGFFGSLNATVTMPELELLGEFGYPGAFLLDTVRFSGTLQRIPTIVAGQVREYTHVYVTGTASAGNEGLPIDTLRLGGNLWITSGGSLNLEGAGDSLFVRIGSPGSTTRRNLAVLTGGLLSMQDAGVVVLVSGSAQFAGGDHTGLLTAGELRVESGFSGSTPNAFVAGGDHRTRLGGNGLLDFYSVNVTEGALVRFGRLQLTPQLFTATGSFAADSLLMPDGGTLEMPVANTGLTVAGRVETSTTAALDVARLSIGGSLQYNGSTPIDTIVLTGNAQRLLAETDSAVSPLYSHLRVTGIVQTQIPDAGMLQVTGDLEVLESGSLEVGELGLNNYLEVLGSLIVRGPVAQLTFADGQLFADSVHVESGGTSAPSSGTMISRSFVQLPFGGFHEAWRPTGTFENRLQGTGTIGFSLDGASFFNRLQFAAGSDMTLLSSVMATGLVTRGEGLGTLTLRSNQPGVTVPTLSTFGGINFPVTGGAVTLRSAALNVAGAFGPGDEGIVNVNNVTFTQMQASAFGMLRAVFTGDVDPTWANITFDSPLDGPYYFRFEPAAGAPTYDGQTITFVNATPAVECLVGVCLPGEPVVPSGGFSTATWDGSTDANWNEPTNWSTGVVPTATTQVTIPAGLPQPVLDANAQVASLTVDASATLTVGAGDTLTVWGDIVANGTVGGLDDASVVWMRPTTLASLSGAVEEWNATLLVGAGLGGAGGVQMASNFTLSGGPTRGLYIFDGNFDVFGFGLTVNGTLATGALGRLVMNTGNPLVEVGGDAIFSGASTEGWLTDGRLRVSGSLFQGGTSSTSFASTVNHVLEFFGPDASSLVFTSPGAADSRVATLEVNKAIGIEVDLLASDAYAGSVVMTEGVLSVDNFTLIVTANFAATLNASFVLVGSAGTVNVTGFCANESINVTGLGTFIPSVCRAP